MKYREINFHKRNRRPVTDTMYQIDAEEWNALGTEMSRQQARLNLLDPSGALPDDAQHVTDAEFEQYKQSIERLIDDKVSDLGGGSGCDCEDLTERVEGLEKSIDEPGGLKERVGSNEQNINDLLDEVFPLKASYVTNNSGTREVGTPVSPSVTVKATRKGADITPKTAISTTAPGATISETGWSSTALSSGNNSYRTTVIQGGQTVDLGYLSWNFTNYRYRGAIDSVPKDYGVAIKALPTKELATSPTLGSTALAKGKYYLFAVIGEMELVVRHAQTGGIINGCESGTVILEQENKFRSNTYSYVLVPASSMDWNFTISNS